MSWPPFECEKCHRMWNTYPGAINYCNHMGACPQLARHIMSEARDPLLEEREKTHGSFKHNADTFYKLWEAVNTQSIQNLPNDQQLALNQIFLKISRMLQNPLEPDHWKDIAGYAKLGEEACYSK
jgi:hypothetical protein